MNSETAPKSKSPLPTILLTSFLTALFLFLLLAGGAYWFVNKSTGTSSIDQPAKSPADKNLKPTPRTKNRSSVSASEITKVEFREDRTSTRASAAQFFGNVNPANFVSRSTTVSFSADGSATKVIGESGAMNGIPVSPTPQKYSGATTRDKFVELAQILVENDFLGENDSKTSTSLPIKFVLTVAYSSGEKTIQTSNSGNDTPEVDAMLKAFRNLENSIAWRKE